MEKRPGDGEPDRDPVLVTYVCKCPFDLAAQVPRDPVGCLNGAQATALTGERLAQLVELCLETLGEEPLVETRP